MRCRSRLPGFSCLVVALFCLLWFATGVRSQTSQVAGSGNPNELSTIRFTIVDKDSHFVDGLRMEDLRLLQDNKPREISALRKFAEQPLSLVILIDTSVSQERTLPKQRAAADGFLQAIMRAEKDHAAVATFTEKLTVALELSNDLSLLQQTISRVQFVPPPGYVGRGTVIQGTPPVSSKDQPTAGSTAIWDALWQTTEQLMAPAPADSRKVIILLTDGQDTASQHRMREAIARSVAANVAIYAIGIGDKYSGGIDEGALRKVAEQTGGRSFVPKKELDLAAVFAEIQQELRYQYEVTYRSAGKASPTQKVQLELVNPSLRAKDLRISYPRITTAK